MSHLLALSFDVPSSPAISLKAAERLGPHGEDPFGWGFAWYPAGDNAAVVIKDPTSIGDNAMTKVLRHWERFNSSIYVCHIRGAAQRRTQQDTHPFTRSYAGRDWIFAHNGDLTDDLYEKAPLEDPPLFEPVGLTDTEHAFCWLMGQIRQRRLRRLADVGWSTLHEWFQFLNRMGTANFLFADGSDLLIYHDRNQFNGLNWERLTPPHPATKMENEEVVLTLDDALDVNRSLVVFSTRPMTGDRWAPMQGGQMLVARNGAIIWDSHDSIESVAGGQVLPPVAERPAVENVQSRELQKGLTPADMALAQTRNGELKTALRTHSGRMRPVTTTVRRLSVYHSTVYTYDNPVERSTHTLRLRPVHDLYQTVVSHELEISVPCSHRRYADVFGNQSSLLEIETPFNEMRIVTKSVVVPYADQNTPLQSFSRRSTIPLVWMPWQRQMMNPYLLPPELPETQLRELSDFAMSFVHRQDFDLIETLIDMNLTIYRDFAYVSGSTTLATTPFQVYVNRRGVCQDFANLLICMARLLGIPARYRVGYIYTGGNYENKMQSDASHAWVELYLPWVGWRGFDPTNGCLAGTDHVRVACGRNYLDATPTSGTIFSGGGKETLKVDVKVDVLPEFQDASLTSPPPPEHRGIDM